MKISKRSSTHVHSWGEGASSALRSREQQTGEGWMSKEEDCCWSSVNCYCWLGGCYQLSFQIKRTEAFWKNRLVVNNGQRKQEEMVKKKKKKMGEKFKYLNKELILQGLLQEPLVFWEGRGWLCGHIKFLISFILFIFWGLSLPSGQKSNYGWKRRKVFLYFLFAIICKYLRS